LGLQKYDDVSEPTATIDHFMRSAVAFHHKTWAQDRDNKKSARF